MRPRLVREKEPEYFIRLSEEMDEAGPFTLEILREMAESGEILRETWFRLESETEYRRFEEDLPLAADLWPDDEPFDPELEISDPADTAPAEESEEDELGSTDTRQLLQENVLCDRETRQVGAEPESSVVWTILKEQKWIFVRWILAIGLLVGGIFVWSSGDAESSALALTFIYGLGMIVGAIVLTIPETIGLVMAPVSAFFEMLLQGSGGGGKADFWTANELMSQGDFNLAMTEYRRIARDHPREVEAYLKGIQAARAMENEREEERFREMALKNLKSAQDRSLFLSSLERMS